MPTITDVSPTTIPNQNTGHSPIGRMLSIACSPDGQEMYAGSYSNLWVSYDGGKTWQQIVWPQPDPTAFDVPGSLGGWCVVDIAVSSGLARGQTSSFSSSPDSQRLCRHHRFR